MTNKIEKLQASVKKATEKVEKCKGTIVRHEKALDKKIKAVIKAVGLDLTGKTKAEIEILREPYRSTDDSWTIYEVVSKLEDIRGANKKLKEAEIVLSNWEIKLTKEVEKDDFLSNHIPQVIKDFLEQWKEMAFDWHVRKYNSYQIFKQELNDEVVEAYVELGIRNGMPPSREQRKVLEEKRLDYRSVEKRKANFAGAVVLQMCTIRDEAERLAWLDRLLEEDKKAKMLDLINRINAVVGEITDATKLSVDVRGNLNGIITGEKGKAKVETIGAGGYNIQCFHYRTLVNKI